MAITGAETRTFSWVLAGATDDSRCSTTTVVGHPCGLRPAEEPSEIPVLHVVAGPPRTARLGLTVVF